MWSVAVAIIQILTQSFFFLLAKARAAEQTETQSQTEATEHTRVPQPFQGAPMHVHDRWTVRPSQGARSALQRSVTLRPSYIYLYIYTLLYVHMCVYGTYVCTLHIYIQ